MASHVFKIDDKHVYKIKKDLTNSGFTLTEPQYTHFQAKKPGLSVTLYLSGKCVIQGKGSEEFIEFYLEPHIIKTFGHTYPETKQVEVYPHIGIDESGKGDFFGPLCISGVYADENGVTELQKAGVKDSKKMTDLQILKLATTIKKLTLHHSIRIGPEKYNELYPKFKNLNTLLGWGHATCIEALIEKSGCKNVLIDQFANESVVINALQRKKIHLKLEQRHRGEEDVVVAAASILARENFLKGLANLEKTIHSKLPKGASRQVVTQGQKIYQEHGEAVLLKVGKKHFKTWKEVTQ